MVSDLEKKWIMQREFNDYAAVAITIWANANICPTIQICTPFTSNQSYYWVLSHTSQYFAVHHQSLA